MLTTRAQKRKIEEADLLERDLEAKRQNNGIGYCTVVLENIDHLINNAGSSTTNETESACDSENDAEQVGDLTAPNCTKHDAQVQTEQIIDATSTQSNEEPQNDTKNDVQEKTSVQNQTDELVDASSAQVNNEGWVDEQPETEEERMVKAIALRGTEVEYEMVASNKVNLQVLFSIKERQRYKKSKYNQKLGYYAMICCIKNCKARLYLYDDGKCVFAANYEGHKHSTTQEQVVAEHHFKQKYKEQCSSLNGIGGKLPSVKEIYEKLSDE